MGKYSTRTTERPAPKRNIVNPYMRGIGCLLMVVVPVFCYFLGDILAEKGIGAGILPADWYIYPIQFPDWVYKIQGLSVIAGLLRGAKHAGHLRATLAFAFTAIVVVGGIVSVIFGYMYSIFAPSKYGPTDVPPVRVKTKKYKR